MKKLATLFGTLALVSTLSLTGCKKKEEASMGTEAPKATEPATTEPAATEPAVAPTEPAAPAPAAAGDMPAECTELKAALEKLSSCADDKAPAAVKEAYANTWTGIETAMTGATTPEAQAAVGASCKASIDTLKTAAADCM